MLYPGKKIKLILVEDDEIDRLAFKRASRAFHIPIDYVIVESIAALRDYLSVGSGDVIFTDYYLDDGTALEVIDLAGNVPVLVATGSNEVSIAVEVLKKGAYDFLIKDIERNYLSVLPYTVQKVIQKQRALDNEKMLSSVVTNINDSVVIVNMRDEIVFANPAFVQTYGYRDSEIIGMPASILVPLERRQAGLHIETNVSDRSQDAIHQRKDGTLIHVSVTMSDLKNETGEVTSRIAVIRDVTERVSMLEMIRSSQQRLSTIFDNSAIGIAMFDMAGHLVEFNSVFRDFSGHPPSVLKMLTMHELSHPEDRRIDSAQYGSLIGGKIDSYVTEKRMIQASGEALWVKMSISMVKDEGGKPSYIIAMLENINEKKRIEYALKESEVRIEAIMSSLEDVVYSINPETLEINYVNHATRQVFEMEVQEFKDHKTNWRKMIHGGDLGKLEKSSGTLIETGRSDTEYRIITPSGDIKWIRDRSWIVTDSIGIPRVDGIITDVTQRKQAEQAHRDSEERYRTAVQSSVEAVYMLNPVSQGILDVNDAFCKLLGYSKSEALELKLTDFVQHDSKDIMQYVNRVIDEGRSILGERIWKRKDGAIVNVQATASMIKQREQEILFVVARDITLEKKIKDALEQERKLLKEVVASAPIPMAMLDANLAFIVHSRTWVQQYGPRRKSLGGQKLFDLYDFIPEKWRLLCAEGLTGKVLNIPEEEVVLNDGSVIYLRLAIHPWGKVNSDRYGIVLVAERIDELVNARKQAEEANLAKSAFLARITHELRTPLNAILGFSQIMKKDDTLAETHRNYVDSMYRSGMHLLTMINDILDLSKIEASRMEIIPVPTDLRELLHDSVEMFRLKCESKGISLQLDIGETLHPFVNADRAKLNQVLINLVGNAVKFTDHGSVAVTVGAKPMADDETTLVVVFRVKDSGIGIPEDELEAIFEPFHQARNTSNQGTGLGLSITRRIIQLMGGQISVISAFGKGSLFEFQIPFLKMDAIPEQIADRFGMVKAIQRATPFRVLVVDDVEHNRTVVRLLLERIGADVFEATNGLEAVEVFHTIKPELIIMDIIMPVMDGVRSMTTIRATASGRNVPIIALTASGFDDKREKLLEAGFSDYILKPFTEPELLRSIHIHANVEYIYEEQTRVADVGTTEGLNITTLMQELRQWDTVNLKALAELLEFQDFDGMLQYLDESDAASHSPATTMELRKAVQAFDFYFVTRLSKLLHEQIHQLTDQSGT